MKQSNKGGDKVSTPPQYYSSTLKHLSESRDLYETVTHTAWYRGMGPTKLSYVLALISLGGEATKAQMAEATGRKASSISRPLVELDEAGIIEKVRHGVYRVNLDNLPEEIHRYREESQEFRKDESIKREVERRRKIYASFKEAYIHEEGRTISTAHKGGPE